MNIKEKKVYLAGPMSNIQFHNFPAFDCAAQHLREQGHHVVSPAELDDPATRKAAFNDFDGTGYTGATWGEYLGRDVQIVADEVNAVMVLPGWQKSRGARLETFVAALAGHPVYKLNGKRISKLRLSVAWILGL